MTSRLSSFALLLACCSPGQDYPCKQHVIPEFADVTATAGITFEHAADSAKAYIFSSMAGGVLLLDYDGDGWLDIYFTNSPTYDMMQRGEKARSALYHNNHNGTFTDVTDRAGVAFPCAAMGGAAGDYNNDGHVDMLITCLEGVVLYRNNGDGTFTDVTQQSGLNNQRWNTGAAFADYDSDGWLDLALASYVALDFEKLPTPGSAPTCMYRGIPVQCGPHGMEPGRDSLFHNRGDGSFTDVTTSLAIPQRGRYYGLGLLWADFDGTGRPSLFVANDSTPNDLFSNLGHGKFSEIALEAGVAMNADGREQANMGVTAGDYLHSGKPSLALTTFADETKPLYRNDGDMRFAEVATMAHLDWLSVPLLGWGISFADLDNDGWLDLFSVYGHVYPQVDSLVQSAGYAEPKLLFMNERNGSFCSASTTQNRVLAKTTAARGLAVGDLFNDGQVDLIVENVDGSPLVLRNKGVAGNHWIELDLQGTFSNRSAIGAEITLIARRVTQTTEVRSGGSYLSQSDLRAHFGLATAQSIESVSIRWPSGVIDIIHTLKADHIYSVKEGSGQALLCC